MEEALFKLGPLWITPNSLGEFIDSDRSKSNEPAYPATHLVRGDSSLAELYRR